MSYPSYPQAEPAPGGSDRRSRGAIPLIAVAALVAVVIVVVLALRGNGNDSPGAGGAETCEGADCGGAESTTEAAPQGLEIPDGYLGVESLGALTPQPDGPWSLYAGPGADREDLAEDAHAMSISHSDTWISYFMVGRLGEFALDADPSDLSATAAEIVETWVYGYAYSSTTGLANSEPEISETTVDSLPAVLLETQVTWETLDSSPDTYEDVALLLIDSGGDGIFLGVAAVPQSGTANYEAAVAALLETTFQHNTLIP